MTDRWKVGDIAIWRGQRVKLVQEKMRGWFVHDAAHETPRSLFFADSGEMRAPTLVEALKRKTQDEPI